MDNKKFESVYGLKIGDIVSPDKKETFDSAWLWGALLGQQGKKPPFGDIPFSALNHAESLYLADTRTNRPRWSKFFEKELRDTSFSASEKTALIQFWGEVRGIAEKAHNESGGWVYQLRDSINWQAGDFGNPNSCYWGVYSESREYLHALYQQGDGFAICVYKRAPSTSRLRVTVDGKIYTGYGRLWGVWQDDDLILFNPYPDYHILAIVQDLADKMAQKTGESFRIQKVRLFHNSPCYINYDDNDEVEGQVAWVVSSGGHVEDSYTWHAPKHFCTCCAHCNDPIDYDDDTYTDNKGNIICEYCAKYYTMCSNCNELYSDSEYALHTFKGDYYCESCAIANDLILCENCKEYHNCDNMITVDTGKNYCLDCLDRLSYSYCDSCDEYCLNCEWVDDQYSYCPDCLAYKGYRQCWQCKDYTDSPVEIEGIYYCKVCASDKGYCKECGQKNQNMTG